MCDSININNNVENLNFIDFDTNKINEINNILHDKESFNKNCNNESFRIDLINYIESLNTNNLKSIEIINYKTLKKSSF